MQKLSYLLILILGFTTSSVVAYTSIIPKSIYNLDEREIISSSTQNEILKLSSAVGLIFYKDDLINYDTAEKSNAIFSNLLSDNPPAGHNYCPTEKFAEHRAYKRGCTGFLIAKDILITAGHCFKSKNDCHRKLITFNATADRETEKGFKVFNDEVYECKKIIAQEYDQQDTLIDYAIIQLDRKVGILPLKFRQAKKIEDREHVFMIGHPLGLPKIYSSNAHVMENISDVYFKASLDSFHGNSGSPVFNAKTMLVEGVMVRGEIDDDYRPELKCNRNAVYSDEDTARGEGVTRFPVILPALYNKLNFDENFL